MYSFKYWLVLILFSALYTPNSIAIEFSPKTPIQASKQAQRWSLSQWMEQKGKLQWMDVWLGSNTNPPSFYELYLGVDYTQMDRAFVSPIGNLPVVTEDIVSKSGHIGLFVSIFGLHGRYERSQDSERKSWDALAQLRILGTSDQASNLVLFYGLKDLTLSQHQQAGGYLTLYLLQHWAIQGRYSHFFEDTSDSGAAVSGKRTELSTWLEWGPVRVFGSYFKEPIEHSLGGTTSETSFEGFSVGFRTYLDFKK
jgi:hypothetical protein